MGCHFVPISRGICERPLARLRSKPNHLCLTYFFDSQTTMTGSRTALVWTTARLLPRPLPLLLVVVVVVATCHACTNILVTPGASHDGSSLIAYNADSPTLFGSLYHYAAADNIPNGTMRKIYDWDSGVYLGEIPESPFTYNVVGNANEHGLVIGETTFGGVPILAWNQTKGIIDYGSLIYLTLQRCRTIACAIDTMTNLLDTYGYASGGESFSLTDTSGDVWMMEVIGTGNEYYRNSSTTQGRGAVWVAIQIPNGAIAAHANQARIRTFPRNDPDHCKYAPDVVIVAKFYGLYPMDGSEQDFSFADAYDPINFMEARQGEARVWSIFSQIADRDETFAPVRICPTACRCTLRPTKKLTIPPLWR
jgi:dipeptidase